MKVRMCLLPMLLCFSSAISLGQNNCSGAPPTGTCPAPSAPVEVWCAGNNSHSTCPGGTTWLGFDTTSPTTGTWSHSFEGLDAQTIVKAPGVPRPQSDGNGAPGPTNSEGVGQLLEYAGTYVQAYDRATGSPIFSKHANGTAAPQPITELFAPGGSSYCASASLDGIATYDRIDGVFVMANIFNPGNLGTFYYCIGVSAPTGAVPASNLEGSGGLSDWNVYAFRMNPAIPNNPNKPGSVYFPDYARFGSWSDGFYVEWDLEDSSQPAFPIVGFEVCKFDKADMIAGLSAAAPACYTYIPSYIAGETGTQEASLIHTALPADFEGDNPIPANTAGEYFVAQVNPNNPGSNLQCSQGACTSNRLAFWTWSGFTSGAGPTYITVSAPYTPGCYNRSHPWNTVCVTEPYGGYIDSVGDRLMHRLAYRYFDSGGIKGEFLAATHAIQVDTTTLRTGVRYYVIAAGNSPAISHIATLQDTTYHFSLSVPSIAMDANADIGITFTVTGSTKSGSTTNYDPSPFFITVSSAGKVGSPVAVLSNSGNSGQDETDGYWGEYVSVASDPNDDLSFWAVDEYMNGNQTTNCSSSTQTGCAWATRVFACRKGSGC